MGFLFNFELIFNCLLVFSMIGDILLDFFIWMIFFVDIVFDLVWMIGDNLILGLRILVIRYFLGLFIVFLIDFNRDLMFCCERDWEFDNVFKIDFRIFLICVFDDVNIWLFDLRVSGSIGVVRSGFGCLMMIWG